MRAAGLVAFAAASSSLACERSGVPASMFPPPQVAALPTSRVTFDAGGPRASSDGPDDLGDEPCARAASRSRAALTRGLEQARARLHAQAPAGDARDESERHLDEEHALDIKGETSSARCWTETPGARDAWALVVDEAAYVPLPSATASTAPNGWKAAKRVALAYVGASGAMSSAPVETLDRAPRGSAIYPTVAGANCCEWGWGQNVLEAPIFRDFDGDGSSEAFVRAVYHHEGAHQEWSAIFTRASGTIAPYAKAPNVPMRALEDVDGDGRVDILYYEQLNSGESCGSGFPIVTFAPPFVAHALPDGSFSTDDAAARAFVSSRWCKSLPARLSSSEAVVCMRVRGKSASEVTARIERELAPWSCDAENAGAKQAPRASRAFEPYRAAAQVAVPFVLRK